jgi:hypothetical protein
MVNPIECPKCNLFAAFRVSDPVETHQCDQCGFAFRAFVVRSMPALDQMEETLRFEELSEVVLAQPIEAQGVSMPTDARGVVMAAWADGLAYEVEFETPQHAVLTVEASDLKAHAGRGVMEVDRGRLVLAHERLVEGLMTIGQALGELAAEIESRSVSPAEAVTILRGMAIELAKAGD